jgi:uncharacterized BrkB/YihY/UPF0761 family membrane protein
MKSTRFLVIALLSIMTLIASVVMIATTKVDINQPWDDQTTLRLIAIVGFVASMITLAVSAYFTGIGKKAPKKKAVKVARKVVKKKK